MYLSAAIYNISFYVWYIASGDDDDSVSVAVISGAVVGTSLLTIIIIIIIMLVVIMILCRMKKKSRRPYNIDDKDVQLSSSHLPQQHTASGQSLHHVITLTVMYYHN